MTNQNNPRRPVARYRGTLDKFFRCTPGERDVIDACGVNVARAALRAPSPRIGALTMLQVVCAYFASMFADRVLETDEFHARLASEMRTGILHQAGFGPGPELRVTPAAVRDEPAHAAMISAGGRGPVVALREFVSVTDDERDVLDALTRATADMMTKCAPSPKIGALVALEVAAAHFASVIVPGEFAANAAGMFFGDVLRQRVIYQSGHGPDCPYFPDQGGPGERSADGPMSGTVQ